MIDRLLARLLGISASAKHSKGHLWRGRYWVTSGIVYTGDLITVRLPRVGKPHEVIEDFAVVRYEEHRDE